MALRRHVLRLWEWGDDGCLEGNYAEDVLLAGGGIDGEVDCLEGDCKGQEGEEGEGKKVHLD